MSEELRIVSDDDLGRYEEFAKSDLRKTIGQQAAARRTLELLAEVRTARRLVRGLYHHIPDVKGTEELQAELERYAGHLGVIKPAPPK